MATEKNSIDMVNGSLWGKILKFSLLYMVTALLQELYSAADVLVVGRFAGDAALAGVGTCTVIVNFFINFILGLSAGATIVLGQAIGAKNGEEISKVTHTSIATAIVCGLFVTLICQFFYSFLLGMIDVPEDIFPEASSYLRIVSLGFIPSLVYNFGASILRAKGDTKRALYIVMASGIINVLLNLFFVCVLKMTASGVAVATVISQIFTAVSILYLLCREKDETRLVLKNIRIHRTAFLRVLRFGLPSGIQSSVYSASGMIVQASVNSFGKAAIAASSAVTSITNFYNVMVNSLYQASMVFTSQNFGARKFERIKKTIFVCMTYVVCIGILQSFVTYFFGESLVSLYVKGDPEVLGWGVRKFNTIGYTYALLGFMNIMSGALRGMGASFINMVTSIVGVCGIRIVWIMTVFKTVGTIESLFLCYPVSWVGTMLLHVTMIVFVFRKNKAEFSPGHT